MRRERDEKEEEGRRRGGINSHLIELATHVDSLHDESRRRLVLGRGAAPDDGCGGARHFSSPRGHATAEAQPQLEARRRLGIASRLVCVFFVPFFISSLPLAIFFVAFDIPIIISRERRKKKFELKKKTQKVFHDCPIHLHLRVLH